MQRTTPYLNRLNAKQRSVLERILQDAQTLVLDAQLSMPYGVPGFIWQGKKLFAVAAHAQHIGIYPFSPTVVRTVATQIPHIGTSKGTLRFSYDAAPSKHDIQVIITARMHEIQANK